MKLIQTKPNKVNKNIQSFNFLDDIVIKLKFHEACEHHKLSIFSISVESKHYYIKLLSNFPPIIDSWPH